MIVSDWLIIVRGSSDSLHDDDGCGDSWNYGDGVLPENHAGGGDDACLWNDYDGAWNGLNASNRCDPLLNGDDDVYVPVWNGLMNVSTCHHRH